MTTTTTTTTTTPYEDENLLCDKPRRRGILVYPIPSIASCGCYDDLIIPITIAKKGIRWAIQKLLPKGLKESAEITLARTLFKHRINKINRLTSIIKKKKQNLKFYENDLSDRIIKAKQALEEAQITLKRLRDRLAENSKIIFDWNVRKETIQRALAKLINYFLSDNIPPALKKRIKLKKTDPFSLLVPEPYVGFNFDLQIIGFPHTKFPMDKIEQELLLGEFIPPANFGEYGQAVDLVGQSIGDGYKQILELKPKAEQALKEIKSKINELQIEETIQLIQSQESILSTIRDPIDPYGIGEDIIPAGTLEQQYAAIQVSLLSKIQQIENIQDDIKKYSKTSPYDANQAIDAKYPNIASEMITVILDMLQLFTLVGPHDCRPGPDGATLDEETCICDICPPDKELCQPYTFDPGIRLPWTVIADSANYCLEPCCDGKLDELNKPLRVYKPNSFGGIPTTGGISELLGLPQCVCECPNDDFNQPTIKRPCQTSECDDDSVCASAYYPDDICRGLPFFAPYVLSKFYWYDGSDPSKPLCGFRCKEELSNADCFAFYGEYTKWNNKTNGCTCICQEKSETNCPEKATYTQIDINHPPVFKTFCELMADPPEPQCSCICDRPDDCPPGTYLNRSGPVGPDFCECLPLVTTTTPSPTTTPPPTTTLPPEPPACDSCTYNVKSAYYETPIFDPNPYKTFAGIQAPPEGWYHTYDSAVNTYWITDKENFINYAFNIGSPIFSHKVNEGTDNDVSYTNIPSGGQWIQSITQTVSFTGIPLSECIACTETPNNFDDLQLTCGNYYICDEGSGGSGLSSNSSIDKTFYFDKNTQSWKFIDKIS